MRSGCLVDVGASDGALFGDEVEVRVDVAQYPAGA